MKTIAKLIREDTKGTNQDNNQKLLLDLINGIGSLEQAKKHFSHYLTTIQNKDNGEYFISLGAFEDGLDNAIDEKDIVHTLSQLDKMILKLKT